jgi:hypothetical protein
MNPEQQKQFDQMQIDLNNTKEKLDIFLDVYYRTNFVDKVLFIKEVVISNKMTFSDAVNMAFGGTIGTKIGTSATQKISLYGATPVVQAGAITAPTGGGTVDSQSRTAIGLIINALHNIGIIG